MQEKTKKLDDRIKETKKIDDVFDDKKNKSLGDAESVYGKLLRFLRQNKYMILYNLYAEIDKVYSENGKIYFKLIDEQAYDILNDDENRRIVEDYFKSMNMSFDFDFVSRDEIEETLMRDFQDKLNVIK